MDEFFAILLTLAVFVVIYFIALLPFYFILKKTRFEAWVAFVPLYNVYMMGRVAKNETLGVLNLLVFFVSFLGVMDNALGSIISLGVFIFSCYVYVNLANRFDQGLGCKIVLCLPIVGWIMLWILGLDKSYVYNEFKEESLEEILAENKELESK